MPSVNFARQDRLAIIQRHFGRSPKNLQRSEQAVPVTSDAANRQAMSRQRADSPARFGRRSASKSHFAQTPFESQPPRRFDADAANIKRYPVAEFTEPGQRI